MKSLLIIFIFVCYAASFQSERKGLEYNNLNSLLSNLEDEKDPNNEGGDDEDNVTPPEVIVAIILCIFAGVTFYVCFFICVFAAMVASVLVVSFFVCVMQVLPAVPMGITGLFLWATGHRPLEDESEELEDGREEEKGGSSSSEGPLEDILMKRGKYENYEPREFGVPNFHSETSESSVASEEPPEDFTSQQVDTSSSVGRFPPPPHFSPSRKTRRINE